MLKKFPIEIDIFKSFVHINIGSKDEIEKECFKKGHMCPSYKDISAHVYDVPGENPVLYLLNGFSNSTLVHESVHCANAILRNIGIRPCEDSEEAYSYLIEYIFEKVSKNRNKKNV